MSEKSHKKEIMKNLYANLGNRVDTNINEKDSNKDNMNQNESIIINKHKFTRKSIAIRDDNKAFIEDYCDKTGIPVASKLSELINKAIDEFKKESK
jgi:3-dehydroquinate dehydratase